MPDLEQACLVPRFDIITFPAAVGTKPVGKYMVYKQTMFCDTTEHINITLSQISMHKKEPNEKNINRFRTIDT